jgi:hypothetical protein
MKKLITALAVLILLTSCKPTETAEAIATTANTATTTYEISTASATTTTAITSTVETTATEIATTTETIEPAESGGVYIKTKKYPVYVDSQDSTKVVVLGYSDEIQIIEKERDGYLDFYTADDCSASLLITQDGDGAAIYYISDEVQEVIKVKDYADCVISGNGNAFVYASGTKPNEYTLTLYRDGKTEVLTEKADNGVYISPDGSAVVWGEDYNDSDDTFTTMLYLNGKIETLGNSLGVFGLTDNAGKIYYYSYKDNSVYAQKAFEEENRVKIVSADYLRSVVFNNDVSQMILVVSDGGHHDERTYFYEFGNEPVKISDEYYDTIAPVGYNGATDLKKAFYGSSTSIFDSSVYGLDENLIPYCVVSDADHYALSPDGTEMLYVKDYKLCSISTSNEDNEETALYDNVGNFAVSEDFKDVYFVTRQGELRYLEGKDKSVLVTDGSDDFAVSGSDVYYLIGSEVYKGTKGSGELVGKIDYNSRDIYYSEIVIYDNNQILINVYNDAEDINTYFVSNDGKKFTNIDYM